MEDIFNELSMGMVFEKEDDIFGSAKKKNGGEESAPNVGFQNLGVQNHGSY